MILLAAQQIYFDFGNLFLAEVSTEGNFLFILCYFQRLFKSQCKIHSFSIIFCQNSIFSLDDLLCFISFSHVVSFYHNQQSGGDWLVLSFPRHLSLIRSFYLFPNRHFAAIVYWLLWSNSLLSHFFLWHIRQWPGNVGVKNFLLFLTMCSPNPLFVPHYSSRNTYSCWSDREYLILDLSWALYFVLLFSFCNFDLGFISFLSWTFQVTLEICTISYQILAYELFIC